MFKASKFSRSVALTTALLFAVGAAQVRTAAAASVTTETTVAISASPSTVALGGSTTLTWSTTNATTCLASGGWTGTKAASGTLKITPTKSGLYWLACNITGGTVAYGSATVTVTHGPGPALTLTASPSTIIAGASSTLSWTSTGAKSCTAWGSTWSGAKGTAGSLKVTPTKTTSYLLTCNNAGGTGASETATVTVAAAAPTDTITASPASVVAGNTSTLTWSSTNATSCTASGAWSGTKATSGTAKMVPAKTGVYTLLCSAAGGIAATQSATIAVTTAAASPTVSLSATPTSVTAGGTSTVKWTSTNTTACTASGGWTGAKATSGSAVTPALTVATSYALTCTGAGGTASATTTVAITAASSSAAPTAASASKVGPYTIKTYTAGIASGSHYSVPKIYYPVGGTAPYPGAIFITGLHSSYTEAPYTVVINGKTVVEADVTQWGTLLASHGFIVMFIDATNYDAAPPERATALLEAVEGLAAENTRSGSPIAGQLQAQNIAVTGHSFGAAGALYAADGNTSTRIKGVVALNPVPNGPFFPSDRVPSLMMGGDGDPYITGDYLEQEFDSLPDTTPRLLAKFKNSPQFDSMHAIALTPLGTHTTDPVVARLVLSFLEVYLVGDVRYKPFLINDASLLDFDYSP
jgi:dienelactone hydrolase